VSAKKAARRAAGNGVAARRPKGRELLYKGAEGDFEELLDVPADFAPAFGDFGDRPRLDGPLAAADGGAAALGRVTRLDRGYPLVVTGQGSFRAEHAVALVKEDRVRAVVGDWVVLGLPRGHDKARIERVLPRRTALSRWDGRSRGERQVLAANVDVLMVAQPLTKRGVSADRAARSVVLACEGGMRPAVVLTKADRVGADELAEACAQMRRAMGPAVEVVAVSSLEGRGVDEVRALVPAGGTALLLGESGAGKSTLVNALLGAEVLGVGAVRDRDEQGRHTTVARRMLKVPGAGVLVDAPGLRSLPLLDEERGLAGAYPEIGELVPGCRFRDCTHDHEPGCAVRAGVAGGSVDEVRLAEYRLLAAEMYANRRRLDPSAPASLTQ
jgi:ribosome biogenesis GTPase